MRHNLLIIFLLALFVVPFVAIATELPPVIWLEIEGTCRDYNVTMTVDLFAYGCYDVKIDVTTPDSTRVGQILDPVQGWKSSMYYITNGFCVSADANSASFQVRANTYEEQLNFIGKLRSGCGTCGTETVWQSYYYNVTQDCPELPSNEILLLVSMIVILMLLAGITLYVKVIK